jgi:hypothetical protein
VKLYQIDPLCDGRWAQLVEQHPNASLFHTPEWLRALQGTYAYEPVGFTDADPEQPLRSAAAVLSCPQLDDWAATRVVAVLGSL